jgi:nitrogen regulatory protein PII
MLAPEDLPVALEELSRVITGMTARDVLYSSSAADRTLSYRGIKYKVGATRVAIEILSDDSWADDVVGALIRFEGTGRFDDEFIHVVPVESSYRIRTGLRED